MRQAAVQGAAGFRHPLVRAPEFIGREQELALLTQAVSGPPAVLLIDGEAGIGKSRLVTEFLAALPGRPAGRLVACCPPLRTPCTLGPIVDAVRQAADSVARLRLTGLAGALRPLFPEWAGTLPPAPEPLPDAAATRHRLYRALAELLGCLDISLLVTEDAHWADEATLEFLLFMTSLRPQPAHLVITYRPEDVPGGSLLRRLSRLAAGATGLRLTLGPLTVAETASLVSSMLAVESVSGAFAAFVHEHTDGVPLAVEESVRVMAARADLAPRRNGGFARRHLTSIVVPPTVRDAVLERAERLGAGAREVLRAAAVLSEPVPESILVTVCALPADRFFTGLCEAIDCGLLAEEGPNGQELVSFRHVLAARAVYETIPLPQRRVLHQRAAEALECGPPLPLARLAHHFREAGQTARWCRYGERAADIALAAGDEASAESVYHDLATQGGLAARDVARLLGKTPLATLTSQDRYRALAQALRRVLDAGAGDPVTEAEIRFHLGRVLLAVGEYNQSRIELERSIPHLGHDPRAAARAMVFLGWPEMGDWPASVHLGWLRRAATATAATASADRLCLAVDRITALLMLGEEDGWAEAARLPANGQTAGERLQIARGQLNIGNEAMRQGRYAEADRWLCGALRLSEEHGYLRYRDLVLASRARLDWFTGVWPGLLEGAGELAGDQSAYPPARLEGILVAGLLSAAAGAQDKAEEHLLHVLHDTRQRGAMDYMEAAAALARLWLAGQRTADAVRVTDDPVGIVVRKQVWLWAAEIAPARVSALAAAGREQEASGLVASFARGVRGRSAPVAGAALVTCQAILARACGQPARGATLFSQAAAAWQALPRPYDALLAREQQAQCLLAAGQRDAGLALLAEVLQDMSRLSAAGDAGRVARCLKEHGGDARHVWRGGRRGYGDELSPREREVVRLVAQGCTNKEIATTLFVSPRTVAYHLDSARRKLGVHTRAALVRTALAEGFAAGERQAAAR